MRLLIEHQADVSAQDNKGKTVLFAAVALWGHETVTRLLIKHQADVSTKNTAGWSRSFLTNAGGTALHAAAHGGNEAVAKLLLDMGVDEQTQTNDGQTPGDVATTEGHHQIAALLKAEGVRRAQCVAFAMGHHERLGEGTRAPGLDAEVVRMVLDQV